MEGQTIIRNIVNNPEILSTIPAEIFLLKFLRLNKNNNLRNFILEKKDFTLLPLGYLSKILEVANMNFIYLFNYHNNHYIINDYYDYVIDNNKVVGELNDSYINLSTKDIYDMNKKLVNNSPDMIIVQHEDVIDMNELVNLMSSKKDIQDASNLKTFTKYNFDNLNGNTYKLDVIITKDYKIYFNSPNGKQYSYSKGILKERGWDESVSTKTPSISIYNIDNDKSKKIAEKSKSVKKEVNFAKIDLFANLVKNAEDNKVNQQPINDNPNLSAIKKKLDLILNK